MGFLSGSKQKVDQISNLSPQQQPLFNQLNTALNSGGGVYGPLMNYYQGNLGDNPADFNAFAAPEMRQFNEEIIPGLAEQFAGMGSGGLSSSGFRNAAVSAGADLSERLGALRAQIRQQSAQGLQGLGQQGLGNYTTNIVQPGNQGFIGALAPGIGQGIGTGLAGPLGGAIGGAFGSLVGRNSSPYGQ